MKGYSNMRKAHILAALVMATAVVGCGTITGKKKGNKGSPTAPETTIVDVKVGSNGIATATYFSSATDAKFSCKVDSEKAAGQWEDCLPEGYPFTVRSDEVVTLSVKSIAGGVEDPTPATRQVGEAFAAVIAEKSTIGDVYNSDQLKVSFSLRSGNAQNVHFECRANDETQFTNCTEGTSYTFLGMQDGGTYSLVVRPVDTTTKRIGQEDTMSFRIDFSRAGGGIVGPGGAQVFGQPLILGSYRFAVPQDMNVVTYATNRTITGANPDLYQVDPGSDPFAQSVPCARREVWKTMTGRPLSYCRANDRNDLMQWVNNMTITPNYVEVGTDMQKAAAGYERISVSFFDSSVEFRNNRSRFRMHCGPNRGDVLNYGMIPNVPMTSRFYHGQLPESVDFHWCTRQISINTNIVTVMIGAFINLDGFVGGSPYANAIEVVYMAEASGENSVPQFFARRAQERVLSSLSKGIPLN